MCRTICQHHLIVIQRLSKNHFPHGFNIKKKKKDKKKEMHVVTLCILQYFWRTLHATVFYNIVQQFTRTRRLHVCSLHCFIFVVSVYKFNIKKCKNETYFWKSVFMMTNLIECNILNSNTNYSFIIGTKHSVKKKRISFILNRSLFI